MAVVLQMHAVSIHTNVVGGMTMSEPANDLAIAVAIASSYYEQPIARDVVCIGEVGASSSLFLALHTHIKQKTFASFLLKASEVIICTVALFS